MQIRQIIEGATDSLRSATGRATGSLRNAAGRATGSLRNAAGRLKATWGEHRGRRLAVIGIAVAIFTGGGATAAWALNSEDEAPAGTAAETATSEPAEPPEETSDDQTRSDEAEEQSPEPSEEEPAEDEQDEQAEEPEEEEAPAEPVVPDPVDGVDGEQMDNAVTIIETGKDEGFDRDGWAVALATAMQEAKLYNAASESVPESFEYTDSSVTYSDHDSVGIFQQRTSMGWGSVEELMDVSTSASKFYGSLDGVSGWQDMSIAEAAQTVQVSAHPDLYAQWEDLAWNIIDAYEAAN